jgi:hypothetical protein
MSAAAMLGSLLSSIGIVIASLPSGPRFGPMPKKTKLSQ